MFTGLVEALGTVISPPAGDPPTATPDAQPASRPGRLIVAVPFPVGPGESVAVNGVCLTAAAAGADRLCADVMDRTAATTTLGRLAPGDQVNLERAALPSTRLGGHIVQGHVDGTAVLIGRRRPDHPGSDYGTDPGAALELTFGIHPDLARFVARRGSVTLDGVSLTVADCARDAFTVGLIPTTAQATTLGRLTPGHEVNVEVDVLARYLERLLQTDPAAALAVTPPRGR